MIFPAIGMSIMGPEGSSLLLEDFLGYGAFGFVFKARDTKNGTFYAVKFPQYAAFIEEREYTAFLNEVQAANQIQHPNVVRVVHVEINPPSSPPYLVMEFVEGGTLKSHLDQFSKAREMVDVAHLQTWISDLIKGISAINEKMLHRDLKPDNILLDGTTLKIGDFGLSKVIGAMTRSRSFKGGQHILYMAPEGWKFEKNEIQLDMYAMGIIFFEIASLQYPYKLPQDLSDIEAVRKMHFYQQPQSLREVRSDLPIGFDRVVSRLLEKNPRDRFSDWSEVQYTVEKIWNFRRDDGSYPREAISSLIHETDRRHNEQIQQQIVLQKRQEELEELRQLNNVRQQQLVDIIKAEIAEYNEHSYLEEQITIEQNLGFTFTWRLPYRGEMLSLRFFSIDPPLKLLVGQVSFAGVLYDSTGSGLNYLLFRNGIYDLYGTWRVCRVKYSAVVDRNKVQFRTEPFGFDNDEDIREIEIADQAMHVYEAQFSDKIQDTFLEVATNAMRRKGDN